MPGQQKAQYMTPCTHEGTPRRNLQDEDGLITFCENCGKVLAFSSEYNSSSAQDVASKWMVRAGIWEKTTLSDGSLFEIGDRPAAKEIGAFDLINRFKFHPATEATGPKHELVRANCLMLAEQLQAIVPPGRELSTCITKVEEAMMWANAGIARNS